MKTTRPYDNENYSRIAQAILFMRQQHHSQPDLATIAHQIDLSEYHFQRLFTQWTGISPKRFQQYLTLEYAKIKLAESKNLLDLTAEVGLSSPGRLHDLFVNLEAMTPGEFKTGGSGLQIRYGIHDSLFGKAVIATTERGICNLFFLDSTATLDVESILRNSWINAELIWDQAATQIIYEMILDPVMSRDSAEQTVRERTPLTLLVKGTNFQIQVWRALLKIPFSNITTYQSLANQIGRPTAMRAIGNAVGQNPIAYLIPCHRVIRESGELGGYRWGLERKLLMMGWEASHQALNLRESNANY